MGECLNRAEVQFSVRIPIAGLINGCRSSQRAATPYDDVVDIDLDMAPCAAPASPQGLAFGGALQGGPISPHTTSQAVFISSMETIRGRQAAGKEMMSSRRPPGNGCGCSYVRAEA
jgi:hypothetical protein